MYILLTQLRWYLTYVYADSTIIPVQTKYSYWSSWCDINFLVVRMQFIILKSLKLKFKLSLIVRNIFISLTLYHPVPQPYRQWFNVFHVLISPFPDLSLDSFKIPEAAQASPCGMKHCFHFKQQEIPSQNMNIQNHSIKLIMNSCFSLFDIT